MTSVSTTSTDHLVETVTCSKRHLRWLGGSFMKSPEARAAASVLDLDRYTYYFHGRGGVLGDVGPTVLASVFGFFPPAFVRARWALPADAAGPDDFTTHYAATCHAWARRRLAGFEPAARLATLLEPVADAADDLGSPLFAGWREVPRPDDPAQRVIHLAHLLREHRGGLHLAAVRAFGLSPLEATLTRDSGVRRARFLGWPEPFPPITAGVQARRDAAERLTDQLAAPAFAALRPAQLVELTRLLGSAFEHALPSRTVAT